MSLSMELDLGPGHSVLDGDPATPPKKGGSFSQIFGPCLLCQRAEWIMMPLDTTVSLSPDHIVLHGDPAPTALLLPDVILVNKNFQCAEVTVEGRIFDSPT